MRRKSTLIILGCAVLIAGATWFVVNPQPRDRQPDGPAPSNQTPSNTVAVGQPVQTQDVPASSQAPAAAAEVKPVQATEKPVPAPAPRQPPADPAAFGDNDLPFEVSWNFRGPCPDFLFDWGTHKPENVEQLDDGLKLMRGAVADASEFAVGYQVAGELHGDFEITLDYRDFKSTPFRTDWQIPRIDITGHVFVDGNSDQPIEVLGIAHRRETTGRLRFTATHGYRDDKGALAWKSASSGTERDSGRLRIVRQGTTVFYQTAALGTEDWVTYSIRPIDAGIFRLITFGLRAEDLTGSGEAVLTNLKIRAKSMYR